MSIPCTHSDTRIRKIKPHETVLVTTRFLATEE